MVVPSSSVNMELKDRNIELCRLFVVIMEVSFFEFPDVSMKLDTRLC